MQEINIKTHLIITDIHSEYDINWCGRLVDANPQLKDGMPVFVLISSESRVELNTIDIKHIEEVAKEITKPKGRGAVSEDKTRIYLREVSGKETLIGIVTHKRVKTYAQMYDKVGYKI